MAKVVNTFVKGKLNKDLDARLVPNGEYRDARNVQVSKSEGPDVGELENVLGNKLTSLTFPLEPITNNPSKCIGWVVDDTSNFIYLFTTTNTGEAYNKDAVNKIFQYNALDNTFTSLILASTFLNFSQLYPITANLLDNILFFTDNRNQPRKINIDRAIADDRYYQTEDQISLAKYNPYQAIQLFQESKLGGSGKHETTIKNVTDKLLPVGASFTTTGASGGATSIPVTSATYSGFKQFPTGTTIGYINSDGCLVDFNNTITVGAIAGNPPTSIGVPALPSAIPNGSEVLINFNPYYDCKFAGDPAFLEDKFVRFSYRWRFDDNEYSLLSPFTQPAFIPKQDGYFMYKQQILPDLDIDDQSSTYRSTIVDFMENKADEIKLIFPLPYDKFNLEDKLKIKELEILYKESDGLAVRVIDTIPINDILNSAARVQVNGTVTASTTIPIMNLVGSIKVGDIVTGEGISGSPTVVSFTTSQIIVSSNQTLANTTTLYIGDAWNYQYDYLSKKPFKTLPDNEIIRVFDKIPVKALTQEISGNRIIFGNYQNKHTPPDFLDYNVAVSEKSSFQIINGTATSPGGTVPAGATITVASWTPIVGGATIIVGDYVFNSSGYFLGIVTSTNGSTQITLDRSADTGVIGDILTFQDAGSDTDKSSIIEYPSSSLKQNRNYQVGVVFSDRYGRQSSVILSNNKTRSTVGNSTFIGDTVYSAYSVLDNHKTWPGDSLKVLFNNPIGPTASTVSTNGWPGIYNDNSASSNYNPLGWYSYKIVVKQTEQEYYNVYLPGIMASYPEDQSLELQKTSHVILINDNINKVPRDLSEVGPDQKQYRSSVRLFGRVQNTSDSITYNVPTATTPLLASNLGDANEQYNPGRQADTVSTISTMSDLFDYNPTEPPQPNYFPQFYLFESNPLIARISTEKQIGQISTTNYSPGSCLVDAPTPPAVYPSATINVKNVSGTIAVGMKVEGLKIADNVYVSGVVGAAPVTQITIVQTDGSGTSAFIADVSVNDKLTFIPAFNITPTFPLSLPGIQYLSVYETTPVLSNLDIYWETTTSGLITDLNNLILSESAGGAEIDVFDTGSWKENLSNGGDILSSNFQITNQFGVAIPNESAGTSLGTVKTLNVTLENVIDNLQNNVSNYFILTQPGGSGTNGFNIQTTTDYYNSIYFNGPGSTGLRFFTFNFKVETEIYNASAEAILSNIEISRPEVAGGVGPGNILPSFLPATGSIYTNRYNTAALFDINGVNGAGSTAGGNVGNVNLQTLDLSSYIKQITKNGVVITDESTIAESFVLETSIVGNQLNSKLKLVPNVDVADYAVVIGYEDAGAEVTGSFTVDLERTGNIVPNSFEKGIMSCIDSDGASGGSGANLEQPLARVQINGSPNASENGFYLFAGIPQQPITIEQQMSNNTDVITINRTGANTNPAAGCSPDGSWYFSTISFADVQNKFLSNGCEMSGCDAGSQSVGFGLGAVDFSIVEII